MKKGVVVLLACMFALSLLLVGCGGGGDAKADWTGTWEVVEAEENGKATDADSLQMLKDLGIDTYLELNEDGTGRFVKFGEAFEGTWETKSASEGSFTVGEQANAMSVADDKLVLNYGSDKFTFEKGESRSDGSAASSESASSSAG